MNPKSFKARAPILDDRLQRGRWYEARPRDPRLLWLDKNENTDPELNAVLGSVLRSIDPMTTLAVYPECAPLYQKLGKYLGVSAELLVLATGSDGVIRSAFEALIDAGDIVLQTQPSYAMYEVYTRMYGGKPVFLEYAASSRGPVLEADFVVRSLEQHRPKLFCLPNPDSPTGTIFSPEELTRIIETAADVESVILIDEAYYPFNDWTAIPWIHRYPHLMVVHTFSKAWGMTGLRAGYGVGSNELIQLLHKVRPNYEINSIAVAVVDQILDHPEEMRASVARLIEGREWFLTEMKRLGFATLSSHASFLHVNFGGESERIHRHLADKVLYRNSFSHSSLAGYSRFSATTKRCFAPVVEWISEATGR